MSTSLPLFSLSGVIAERRSGNSVFELLIDSLTIRRGEAVAVVGSSGCGKSTLLDVLAFLLKPHLVQGEFLFTPPNMQTINVWNYARQRSLDSLTALRKHFVGYVPQVGGLLPFLDVQSNISISHDLLRLNRTADIAALTERLGIRKYLRHRPNDLSVGERQRVAIARALAHGPAVVIADEPTAALDPPNADMVLQLFLEETQRRGIAAIIATHDWDRVQRFGLRTITYRMGQTTSPNMAQAIFSG